MNAADQDHKAGIDALVEQFRKDRWDADWDEPEEVIFDAWRAQAEFYVSTYQLAKVYSQMERVVNQHEAALAGEVKGDE